ncbi:MAG TPA: Holotricin-3 precursor [Rhizobium sp.]|nr:Holotricin-3 precursor [Rhizobium sp.]
MAEAAAEEHDTPIKTGVTGRSASKRENGSADRQEDFKMNYLGKIAACTAAVMLTISVPSFSDWSLTAQAYAANGNGAGNGGGNSGGNGSGNGAGNGSNAGGSSPNGASTNTRTQTRTPTGTQLKTTTRTKAQTRTQNTLAVMNAAHASPIARMFAAPNSAVGRVATYDRARTAALALTDPVAREEALRNAVAQLQASFALTLTAAELTQLNAILDAN